MFQILKDQSTADRRRIPILFVDATDGYTPETGVTSPTINISKNGGPFAAGAGTFTQIDATNLPGHYYYQFTTGEIDTLGYISFYAIKSGTTRSYNAVVQVMAYDEFSATNLGLSNLDATVSSRSTLTTAQVNTEVDTALADVGLTTTVTGRIDASVSSRSTLTAANVWDYLTSAATVVGSIGKRIADNLDATVGSRSTLSAANVWDYLTSAATVVGSIGKRIADNLDVVLSSRSTITTAQVNTEVDTALADVGLTTTVTGRIDTNIGSRMATFTYTTPPTTSDITTAIWNQSRATANGGTTPAVGTFGYFLDSRVSTAGGGGGGGGVIIKTGPFTVSSTDLGPNNILDLVKNDVRNIQLFVVDQYGEKIPLNGAYTYLVKTYDLTGTLVKSHTATIDYADGGLLSFDIDTVTTGNTGTYNVVVFENDGSTDKLYGGLKIEVRL